MSLLERGDRGAERNDYIDLESDELGRDLIVAIKAILRPAILNRERAPFDPAEFAQPLQKRGVPLTLPHPRRRADVSNGRQLGRWLCARGERTRDYCTPD